MAAGTLLGGPIGDRIGRKRVIWISILGVAPFTLALPYVGLGASVGLTLIIGFLLASAFPAMVVYAQELLPGRIGTVSGLFFGLAFGLGGIGAALLGQLADLWGIVRVYQICAFLPLIGLLAVFLPDLRKTPKENNCAAGVSFAKQSSSIMPRRICVPSFFKQGSAMRLTMTIPDELKLTNISRD